MPLQNRVDPFGRLQAVALRGAFTGNRGVIHDPETRTLSGRRWTTKAWIICTCDWKGRRRDVWGKNGRSGGAGWSELFFRDEVTALAAGHRPCFYCRRGDARRFQAAFAKGNGLEAASAPEMDVRLHAERRVSMRGEPAVVEVDGLPDGAMVEVEGAAFARRDGAWWRWTWEGYRRAEVDAREAVLITPGSTVGALRGGYVPVWAGSGDPV